MQRGIMHHAVHNFGSNDMNNLSGVASQSRSQTPLASFKLLLCLTLTGRDPDRCLIRDHFQMQLVLGLTYRSWTWVDPYGVHDHCQVHKWVTCQ